MTKVLLVEDDNNLREIYEARLAAEGYEISAAQDGEEALEVAKKIQPDLIISDVMMPRISGFEMLDILRNTQGLKHTKVIMLTALGQDDDRERADSLGADRYLVKSQVTLEDIVKAAEELINGTAEPAADTAPHPASEALSPIAPPNMAAAAHMNGSETQNAPQHTLSSYEDQPSQLRPAAVAPVAAPVVPEVAADPIASNDQSLQEAAQALTVPEPALVAPVAIEPQVAPITVAPEPVAAPVVAPVEIAAPTVPAPLIPATPELQAAPAPVVEPSAAVAVPEPVAAAPAFVAPVTAPTAPMAPPEAAQPALPSLPEIERAMLQQAPVPVASEPAPIAQPVVAPVIPATPELQAAPAPVVEPTAPAPELTRPTLGGAPAPEAVVTPPTQSIQEESSVVDQQINDFMNQFPANVGEAVEADGAPTTAPAAEPTPVVPVVAAPALEMPPVPEAPSELETTYAETPVVEAPVDPVVSASAPTGGQRTIQPLTPAALPTDINELAAREGNVIAPAGTPDLPHQPGGVFTPNQDGSAQDSAL